METQTTPTIKLIAVDLDGTLLNSQHTLSERNRSAVLAAIAQGVHVILATGKTRKSAEGLIASLNLKTPGIFSQGLIVYNADGSVRHQQALDAALARRIITFAEERGFALMAYSGNRLLVKARHPILDQVQAFGEPEFEEVGPLVNLLGTTVINKFIAGGDDRKLKALRWQLEQQINGRVSFTTAQVKGLMEILPAGASKGKALRGLIQEMGISADEVMAIGDGENDMEMVKLAGLGIAVGNAFAGLKAAARHVVSSNDADGVAEAIERFVLPPKPAAEPPAASTDPASDKEQTTS